jgi:CheY-like chemotaxis protein
MKDVATGPDDSTGPVVLVVDDDPAMRAVLAAHLNREGYAVIGEASAEGAAALVEKIVVDVAILDKEMPGAGGLDFLSSLRRRCPDLPIVVITAFGGPHVAREVFERGASRYLEKPFRISDLLVTLRTLTCVQRDGRPQTRED